MLVHILRYIFGYLHIRITGHSPERFINLCANKEIVIWDLQMIEDSYEFYISNKDFKELKPIAKKTKTKVSITEKIGLPFFLYKYKKRKLFFIGFFLCCTIVYILSLFIWDIKINGTYHYSSEEILKFVETNYANAGMLQNQINCNKIEEAIRKEYEEVAWVCCELKGTQMIISIKESLDTKTKNISSVSCDIIANKGGVVSSIITRNGTPLVKKGDVFKKGDVLISGVVNIYNDYQEVLESNYVAADGDIYAQTICEYEDSFDVNYYQKEYTKNEKIYYSLLFFNTVWTPYTPKITYMNYDLVQEINKFKIGETFFLPIGVQKNIVREYNIKRYSYDEDSAKKKAEIRLEKFQQELIQKGIQILENNVIIRVDDTTCTAKGSLTLIEPVGKIRNMNNGGENSEQQ